jgi:hypothetical protein
VPPSGPVVGPTSGSAGLPASGPAVMLASAPAASRGTRIPREQVQPALAPRATTMANNEHALRMSAFFTEGAGLPRGAAPSLPGPTPASHGPPWNAPESHGELLSLSSASEQKQQGKQSRQRPRSTPPERRAGGDGATAVTVGVLARDALHTGIAGRRPVGLRAGAGVLPAGAAGAGHGIRASIARLLAGAAFGFYRRDIRAGDQRPEHHAEYQDGGGKPGSHDGQCWHVLGLPGRTNVRSPRPGCERGRRPCPSPELRPAAGTASFVAPAGSRKPARCLRTTVSGLTLTSASAERLAEGETLEGMTTARRAAR